MDYYKKTKPELIKELKELRKKNRELENLVVKYNGTTENLKEKENPQEDIFKVIPSISFITLDLIKKDIPVKEFSHGSEQIFGYKNSEIIGKPFSLLHLKKDTNHFKKVFNLIKTEKKGFYDEVLLCKKSGKNFPCILTVYPVFNDTDELTSAMAIAIDISEKNKFEKALHYRGELESLLITISTYFINLTEDKIDRGINQALKEIGVFFQADRSYVFIFSKKENKIKNTHKWYGPHIEDKYEIPKSLFIQNLFQLEEEVRFVDNIHIPAVSKLPYSYKEKELLEEQNIKSLIVIPMVYRSSIKGFIGIDSVNSTRNWSPDIISFLKILSEIIVNALIRKDTETELKRYRNKLESLVSDRTADFIKANEQLKWEIKERARAEKELLTKDFAINSAVSAIAFTDFNGKLTYTNPAFIELWGYERDKEILGKSIFSLHRYPQKIKKIIKNLEKNKKYMEEVIARRKDGTFIDTYLFATLVSDKKNRPVCIMISYIDITEKNKLQARLIQSERMAAKGRLAAFIAHEVNSPLQAISILLSTLQERYKEKELLENIELLENAFNNISSTVQNLLELNRPGAGTKQLVGINIIIKNTISLLKSYLKKKKININLNLSPQIPNIKASPGELNQVFINLINNAVEAIFSASLKERKTKKEITINTYFKKNNIIIEFIDTGPGIKKEELNNIFNPFYTKRKRKGTGMGLFICLTIIEEHKGSIKAKNLKEGGAVFTITLPVK